MLFSNRVEAGQRLASRLEAWRGRAPVVLGLPRGGVIVAREVAHALGAPLDVLVARKLGAPGQPELAIGAVTARGTRVLHAEILRYMALAPGYLEAETSRQQAEAARREANLRGILPAVPLEGEVVLIVDDGIATGMTMMAAIADVQAARPASVVVAAPVIAASTLERLTPQVDAVVAIAAPQHFRAVGEFYADFSQTTDDEVQQALNANLAPRLER